MTIKLTKQERLDIQNNQELMGQLVLADIIAVENSKTGERHSLWKRPIDEAEARGMPAKVMAVIFSVDSPKEIHEYQTIVDRLKKQD